MLISNEERRKFSEDEKYYEIVGSERMRIKVIRPEVVGQAMKDKRKKEGKSMIVELRAKNPPRKKEFKHKINYAKDREYGGLYYGIFTGLDRFKNPSWYRIPFDREIDVLNLNDVEDMKRFPVIAMHPSIEGTPMSHLQDPVMSVYDPKENSVGHLSKLELIPKVTEFINSLKAKQLVQFARYAGVPVSGEMDDIMIKGSLAEMGISNPREFINLVNSKDRYYLEIYTTALEIGEITDDPEKGYIFNGVYLGASMEEVIEKMRTESGIVNGLLMKISQNDQIMLNIVNSVEEDDEPEEKPEKKKESEKKPDGKKEPEKESAGDFTLD